MWSIYDIGRFLGTRADEYGLINISSLRCSTYLTLLAKSKNNRENCRAEMHRWHACGMREGCYVGYEDDTLAYERFLGATGLVAVPTGQCLFTRCRSSKWTMKLITPKRKESARSWTSGQTDLRLGPRASWPKPDYSPSCGPAICAQRTGCLRSALRLLLP